KNRSGFAMIGECGEHFGGGAKVQDEGGFDVPLFIKASVRQFLWRKGQGEILINPSPPFLFQRKGFIVVSPFDNGEWEGI
ncbi:MAG TPA: hypothetical protein P5150_02585, partial [Candidatus Ratteibacteria bacterium]|nr:hypothetical protein [Candidatus Ratteibacteria bacterium]